MSSNSVEMKSTTTNNKSLEELFVTPRLDVPDRVCSSSTASSSRSFITSIVPSAAGVNTEEKNDLTLSISKLDGIQLLQFLWNTCENIPYPTKRELTKTLGFETTPSTPEIINYLVHRMENVLTYKFLKVDRSVPIVSRHIDNRSWEYVTAIERSSDGTVGVFMIQSRYPAAPNHNHHQSAGTATVKSDIIAAKPYTQAEYENQLLVNTLTTFFKISCPAIRSLHRHSSEWEELKEAVDKFYILPFHEGMYENGGNYIIVTFVYN